MEVIFLSKIYRLNETLSKSVAYKRVNTTYVVNGLAENLNCFQKLTNSVTIIFIKVKSNAKRNYNNEAN